MTTAVEQLVDLDLRLSEREVLRLQGYGARPASPEVTALAAQAIEQARLLAHPQAVFAVLDVTEDEGRLLAPIASGRLLRAGLPPEWRGPSTGSGRSLEKLALALCTVGSELEAMVARLFQEGELALAAMLDSAGSAAVENVADQVNHAICQRAVARQLQAGSRRSPGYAGWPLEEQQAIFKLLPADSIGVQLTEGLMMRPIKSISFGVALGQRLEPGRGDPCRRCGMHGCQFRRRSR